MSDTDLDELAAELTEFDVPDKVGGRSPREERIIAGFEDIQRFFNEHGRAPLHGEDRNIFERLYAVRLDRLFNSPECRTIVEPLDHQGLLSAQHLRSPDDAEEFSLDDLAAELEGFDGGIEITDLRHVRSSAEKRVAEAIGHRDKCKDFDRFRPLFAKVQNELAVGIRESRPFELKAEIRPGTWFIVGGQKAYVADMGEVFTNAQGRRDARLRVIFDNGTEGNMLMRSLQRALHKDDAGRRITNPVAGPLFSGVRGEDDQESGTIYVLRSKSDHPTVVASRDLIHKIGVTTMSVEQRIAGARLQPTFLMADVEIVAAYELFNINQNSLERLIHRVFDLARLEIAITDRFGNPVVPQEWFLVPLFVIDEAVDRIRDGSITGLAYDPSSAKFVSTKT